MKICRNSFRLGPAVVALLIASAAQAADAPADKVLATVNGQPVTQQMLQLYTQRRLSDQSAAPDAKGNVPDLLTDLVTLEVLAQQAVTQGLDKEKTIQAELELQRKDLLAQALLQGYVREHPPTDKELHQAYELVKMRVYPRQYQLAQIQLPDEAKARDLIAQLSKGADFAKLAAQNSTDPTGKKGGDIGWYSLDELPSEFRTAVENLKPGTVAAKPVKSDRGWHVVRLEAVRDNPPPSFDDSRPLLERVVQNRRVQAYVGRLRKDAKIAKP